MKIGTHVGPCQVVGQTDRGGGAVTLAARKVGNFWVWGRQDWRAGATAGLSRGAEKTVGQANGATRPGNRIGAEPGTRQGPADVVHPSPVPPILRIMAETLRHGLDGELKRGRS